MPIEKFVSHRTTFMTSCLAGRQVRGKHMNFETLLAAINQLPEISARLDRIEYMLSRLMKAVPVREIITCTDICSELHISRDQLRSRPWILPSFGQPDFSGRTRKWFVQTWETWKQDLPAREQSWHSMSDQHRKKIQRLSRNGLAQTGSGGLKNESN